MIARGTSVRHTLIAVGICLALVACGSGSSSGSSKVSATQLNNDSTLVDTALATYTNQDASTLTSSAQLSAFVASTKADLAQVRTAFNTWSADLDHVDQSQVTATSKQAYPLMLAYRDALNDWIGEQEQENTVAAACLSQTTALVIEACYAGAIKKYSSTAIDTRLGDARQKLKAALGG